MENKLTVLLCFSSLLLFTVADTSCSDSNRSCSAWARAGQCHQNPEFMNSQCKKACGVCDVSNSNSGRCEDTSSECLALAEAGHCYARPGQQDRVSFMESNCGKSCGYCGTIPDYILDQQSCAQVTDVPKHISKRYKLEPGFYGRFTQAYGLPITASSEVDDRALMRLCYIVRWVFASFKSVRKAAHKNSARFIIIGRNQLSTDMPEYRQYRHQRKVQTRRGIGGVATAVSEESLLHLQDNNKHRGTDLGAHEVAHNFHKQGLKDAKPEIYQAISNAYKDAMAAGKYRLHGRPMYAAQNEDEYFGEALTSYVGDTWPQVPPHNQAELRSYDPAVYQILKKVLPCNDYNTYIYQHNDIDQVISRTTKININYPSCQPEPSINIPKDIDLKLVTRTKSPRYKNPFNKPKSCHKTSSGNPCIFPFQYEGLSQSSCQGFGWCATKTDNSGSMSEWARCDQSCYSTEEKEIRSVSLSQLS